MTEVACPLTGCRATGRWRIRANIPLVGGQVREVELMLCDEHHEMVKDKNPSYSIGFNP